MKVTFLGTGTSVGVPMIGCDCEVCQSDNPKDKRLRTSVAIEHQGQTLVVDTSPDFRYQMLRSGIKQIDALLFTHEHRDHIAGLDDIRAYNFFSQKDMDVYAAERVQTSIKETFPYIFSGIEYPGLPKIVLHDIGLDTFQVNGISVTPIEVMHHKLPVLGFRIDDFTYITDANFISDKEKQKLKGTKTLVLNALRKEEHISHFTLEQAISLVKEIEPERAYFTHISHQLGLHEEIQQELPRGIELAFDGLEIDVI